MNKNLTYKGLICLNNSEYRLVVKDSNDKKIFRTIPISDSENLNDIDDNTSSIACVKFFDGTEQISMEYGVDCDFENIFISLSRDALINIESDKSIFDIITSDYSDMIKFWELVEGYYSTEEGKENFEEYSNKNVWK